MNGNRSPLYWETCERIYINNIIEGKCNNFYHRISHAISRTLHFEEIDANFVRETWEYTEAQMNSQDLEKFGSAVYYNR